MAFPAVKEPCLCQIYFVWHRQGILKGIAVEGWCRQRILILEMGCSLVFDPVLKESYNGKSNSFAAFL